MPGQRLWQAIRSPSRRSLGVLVGIGILAGVAGVIGFEEAMHATNTDEFCVSCHELRDNALAEYVGTPHHTNPEGIQVKCGDCHVPREFLPKMWRKIRAATEVYHHFIGTIDTPAKYDAYRMTMATKTWTTMNENDSAACRYCHDEAAWDLSAQSEKAQQYHSSALSKGKTCIDCHKGIAHKLPPDIRADAQIEGIDF